MLRNGSIDTSDTSEIGGTFPRENRVHSMGICSRRWVGLILAMATGLALGCKAKTPEPAMIIQNTLEALGTKSPGQKTWLGESMQLVVAPEFGWVSSRTEESGVFALKRLHWKAGTLIQHGDEDGVADTLALESNPFDLAGILAVAQPLGVTSTQVEGQKAWRLELTGLEDFHLLLSLALGKVPEGKLGGILEVSQGDGLPLRFELFSKQDDGDRVSAEIRFLRHKESGLAMVPSEMKIRVRSLTIAPNLEHVSPESNPKSVLGMSIQNDAKRLMEERIAKLSEADRERILRKLGWESTETELLNDVLILENGSAS